MGGGPGAYSLVEILEILDCLGLHFVRFHGRERQKETCRIVKKKSQSPTLDHDENITQGSK